MFFFLALIHALPLAISDLFCHLLSAPAPVFTLPSALAPALTPTPAPVVAFATKSYNAKRCHVVVGAECRHAGIMGYTQSVRRFPSMIKGLVICMVTWWFAISVIMEGDEDRMNKDVVFDVLVQCGMVWLMLRLSGRVVGEDGRALEVCEWEKGCHNTVEKSLENRKIKGNK
ncbi:hypothetical protein EDB19DRAFT_1824244 [Suillus lakei]|nr:hypothetical protein EDB19DRAFT_1824244 [Suillus lakei]